jgi:hypothetical protein
LQNGLNIALTLLNSFQIYKLLLDLATFVNGTSILITACMASLLGNDMVNIIMAILVMANLALGLFPTSQDTKPNYMPKRLRSKVTSSVSLFSTQIIQSLNPVLNRISNLIICSSTRKYVKSRSHSQTNRQQGHHGNTARYTAKRKLLPQENYRIYQRANLHQFKSKTTDTANTDKSTTSKLHGKFKFISKRLAQLWCMVAINQVAAPSTKQYDRMSHHLHQTDSDSFLIAIDNCCSRCITNSLDDFVSTPANSTTSVRGLGGSVAMLKVGTVKWSILDDNGTNTEFIIPNVYYNANAPCRLFSPQHVAQELKRIDPDQALSSTTHFDRVVLSWDNGRKTKTIRLDPFSNVALTRSSPGYQQFAMYCEQIHGNDDMVSYMATDRVADPPDQINEIEQSEAPENPIHPDLPNNIIRQQFDNVPNDSTNDDIDATATPQQIFDNETDVPQTDPTSQLLAWHYRLGHLPFVKLQQMAARGDLPASLAKCTRPKCAACMFGKITRRPTADKPSKRSKPKEEFPGSTVSIDHMLSSTPGLIGQMKGFLTRRRYIGACVFVDHFSNLSFVYFQKSLNIEETIEAKQTFERYAASHGVRVQHYHADNGIFETDAFSNEVMHSGQAFLYAGVGAHHCSDAVGADPRSSPLVHPSVPCSL